MSMFHASNTLAMLILISTGSLLSPVTCSSISSVCTSSCSTAVTFTGDNDEFVDPISPSADEFVEIGSMTAAESHDEEEFVAVAPNDEFVGTAPNDELVDIDSFRAAGPRGEDEELRSGRIEPSPVNGTVSVDLLHETQPRTPPTISIANPNPDVVMMTSIASSAPYERINICHLLITQDQQVVSFRDRYRMIDR